MTSPSVEGAAVGEALQVVAFLLGGERFAVDIRAVKEVVSPERLHPIPGVPRPLLGVLLLRGTTVPVVDVAEALGLPCADGRGRDVLVLEHGGRSVGVATDGVLGTRLFPPGSVRPPPAKAPPPLRGVVRMADGLIALLDPHPLIPRQPPPPPKETP